MGNRAVFLDRDGTIIVDVGYLADPAKLELLPRAGEAIKLLNTAGFKVIVTSNQSGVARGLMSEETVKSIDCKMKSVLLDCGALIDADYYCPHHPDIGEHPYLEDCNCRKPKPGLILQASRDHDIELQKSFVIGDRMSDIEAGLNAGCKTILVLTGEGANTLSSRDRWRVKPDNIVSDLYEAARAIVGAERADCLTGRGLVTFDE